MTARSLDYFPLIYLSYDEPWADQGFADVQALRPDAQHVHGVKGLHAAHVAAAEAAGTDHFLTVDADTTLLPSFGRASVPEAYVTDDLQPYWPARNTVNGIVSGNGCVKLWPRALIDRMQSHEAAPADRVSLESDIHLVAPGITRLVPMPSLFATVNPARTPFHAFRAGFRETFFLAWLKAKFAVRQTNQDAPLSEILGVWCNIGRHVPNGDWLVYGARLGYYAALTWRDFDARLTNDYDWFASLWSDHILARIGPGGAVGEGEGLSHDADRLHREIVALGEEIGARSPVPIADLTGDASALVVAADIMPSHRNPREIAEVGEALLEGRGLAADSSAAEQVFEIAEILGDLGATAALGTCAAARDAHESAEERLRQATGMGHPSAPYHLALLLQAQGRAAAETEPLLDLAAERGCGLAAAM